MTQLDLIGPPADPRDKGLLAFCRLHQLPPILSDTFEAGDAWGANCGPMALAAVLGLPTVGAVREFVRPFHGFMNPTHMRTALDRAGARHSDVDPPLRNLGLVRIQSAPPSRRWLPCRLLDPLTVEPACGHPDLPQPTKSPGFTGALGRPTRVQRAAEGSMRCRE
jgi:hypothetical protein